MTPESARNQLDRLAQPLAQRAAERDRLDLAVEVIMEKLNVLDRKLDGMARGAPKEVYLSRVELARMLGCAPRTVDRRVRAGILPQPVRIAGLLRWRASDLGDVA